MIPIPFSRFPYPGHPVVGLATLALLFTPLCVNGQARKPDAAGGLNAETFDAVWNRVNTSYFDPTFGGKDWKAIGDRFRPEALAAKDQDGLRDVLTRMLNTLGKSHMGIIPATPEIDEAFPESGGPEAELYSGLHLRLKGKRVIVSRVEEGSPGEEAGILPGHEIRAIGKKKTAVVFDHEKSESLDGMQSLYLLRRLTSALNRGSGKGLSVTVFEPETGERKITLKPRPFSGEMSRAFGNLPPFPLDFEHQKLSIPDGEVVYLRFGIFVPDVMPRLREAILTAGDARGIVFDLRGNPGGIGLMASGLAGVLTDEQIKLGTMQMRDGHINFVGFPQKGAYLGPVAILVDHLSGSTSEILAGALQELGRARVFGRKTMGAALPSHIVNLPNGDKLQHAIADFRTSGGKAIEGKGVEPDVRVELGRKWLLKGQDKPLEKALAWIELQTPKPDHSPVKSN